MPLRSFSALRFLVTTVTGIAARVVGIALGAPDQFAWDKFAHLIEDPRKPK